MSSSAQADNSVRRHMGNTSAGTMSDSSPTASQNAASRTLELPPSCYTCKYCPSCDPKPNEPSSRMRFCMHGLCSKFVQLSEARAQGHDCYTATTAPLDLENHANLNAREIYHVDGYRAHGNARTHVGSTYTAALPGGSMHILRNVDAGGNSRSHFGNNYLLSRAMAQDQDTGSQDFDEQFKALNQRIDGDKFPFAG